MPNRVEDFMAWRCLWWVYQRLSEIQLANGYNTQPTVTMDYEEYRNASTDAALLVECEGHGSGEQGIGGGGGGPASLPMVNIVILGSVRFGTDLPRRAAMALEQDARTATATTVADMRETIGRGFSLRWNDCTHDAGVLTPEREAAFRLSCSFTYPQGSTW
jgi:hypothetical protein